MASVTKFEEIVAWQEARLLTKNIYQLTQNGSFGHDFGLKDQICRAAVSSMTNIAEGFGADSPRDFVRFLSYARRSTCEVQSLLYAAFDAGYMTQLAFNDYYQQAEKTKALISGFKRSIERRLT